MKFCYLYVGCIISFISILNGMEPNPPSPVYPLKRSQAYDDLTTLVANEKTTLSTVEKLTDLPALVTNEEGHWFISKHRGLKVFLGFNAQEPVEWRYKNNYLVAKISSRIEIWDVLTSEQLLSCPAGYFDINAIVKKPTQFITIYLKNRRSKLLD